MNDCVAYADFLVDCALYRRSPSSRRGDLAGNIRRKYLTHEGEGAVFGTSGKSFSVHLSRGISLDGEGNERKGVKNVESRQSSGEEELDQSPYLSVRSNDYSTAATVGMHCVDLTTTNPLGISEELVDSLLETMDKIPPSTIPPASLFDALDNTVFALAIRDESNFKDSPLHKKYVNIRVQMGKPVVSKDFEMFRALGRGGFGVVNACKKTQSGQLYALKALSRQRIKFKHAEQLCQNERQVLLRVHSPFTVCMHYAFTTPDDIYLVLDLMVGGDMGFYLQRRGCCSSAEARYVLARTVLGLRALHEAGVAYRDLKPDNILMDSFGRTKISDFGQ